MEQTAEMTSTPTPEDELVDVGVSGESFADILNATRARVQASSHKTIPVPGTGGKIGVRFKPPARDRRAALGQINENYRVNAPSSNDLQCQFLVDACDEVVRLDENGGEHHWEAGDPLIFDASDPRWADLATGTPDTARECVRGLYNLDLLPSALDGICDMLTDWLHGVDAEVAARVEGKSEGSAAA